VHQSRWDRMVRQGHVSDRRRDPDGRQPRRQPGRRQGVLEQRVRKRHRGFVYRRRLLLRTLDKIFFQLFDCTYLFGDLMDRGQHLLERRRLGEALADVVRPV
jgi:hypothetical protein